MQRIRLLVRQLHLWLGLGVGALFALLGVTGSTLVFYESLDAWLNPEIRVEANGPAPGWDSPVWDQALATVRTRWPERAGAWRFEATGQAGALPARYRPPADEHPGRRLMVWLTPDGRDVLREAEWGGYAMTWLYRLHMDLLLGSPGRAVVGWSGLVIAVVLVTGLWAWWPKGSWRKALEFKRGAAGSRRLRDLHKLAGLGSLPLLAMLVVTGVMLALPEESNAVLSSTLGPVATLPPVRASSPDGTPIGIAQALAIARHAMPEGRLAWVEAPGPGRGTYMVRVQQPGDPSHRFPHGYVHVDPFSGEILAMQDPRAFGPANVVNNWLHPLHDASVGGLWLRIPVALAGLVPALLFATGWMRWHALRRARGGRAGPPVRQGRGARTA